ncbi:MAG: hypothetical protein AAB378_02120 [Patescibacteria group bacterium]
MSTNRPWFEIYLGMADGAEGDTDWEHEVNELRRAMEDAIASSREVEWEVRRYVVKEGYDLSLYRNGVVEPRLHLAIYPQDILQMPEDIYEGVIYAVLKALHDSPKVSAAVEELMQEQCVNQLTVWDAELMLRTFLDHKNGLSEGRTSVPCPAYRMLDQVDGKPLKAYSLSHLAFWNFLADYDVGKNDEAWLKKLHMKPFNETVPEQDAHPLSASDRWLKSIGMKPFSETFREEKVAA